MYYLFIFLCYILGKLDIKNLYKLGRFLGGICWIILPKRRKVAIINSKIIGVNNPEEIAKESFKNTFCSYLDLAYIQNIDRNFIDKYLIEVQGEEHLLNAIKSKQKFVFFSAHIGSWDLVTAFVTMKYNVKAIIVGRESDNSSLNEILLKKRTTDNVLYVTSKGYLEKVVQYEKEGYIAGSLLDHSGTRVDSIYAPFFGLKVTTLNGIPVLCVRKDMGMLPCYCIRVNGGYKLVIEPMIFADKSLRLRDRVYNLCVDMNKSFEKIISAFPEQWYLLHKRFKKVEEEDGSISQRIYR